MKRTKQTRNTRKKEIVSLAKEGKIIRAHQVARGWPLKEDAAERLVNRWLGIREMEKGDPQFIKGPGAGMLEQVGA